MYMFSRPSLSMGFHVLGRQPDELLTSLATSNSVHHDLFLGIYVSFIIMYLCWK